MTKRHAPPEEIYEIRIQGNLDEKWSHWFNGATLELTQVETDPPVTRLVCRIVDQARLRGIINKIWDMNLKLLSVNRRNETGWTPKNE